MCVCGGGGGVLFVDDGRVGYYRDAWVFSCGVCGLCTLADLVNLF